MSTGRAAGERGTRIVLALDALNCEAALIEAAPRLAGRLGAELAALFFFARVAFELVRHAVERRGQAADFVQRVHLRARVDVACGDLFGDFRQLHDRGGQRLCAELDHQLDSVFPEEPTRAGDLG